MNKLVGAVVTLFAVSALAGSPTVLAADVDIPIDTVIVSGVAEGGDVEVASVASADFAGQSCDVRAVRAGAGPAHVGNDLTISSGDDTISLSDVEREPAAVTEGSAVIALGDIITIVLTMGPDEQFAGDIVVELDCEPALGAASASAADLPVTGSQTASSVLVGLLLLAGGAALLTAARRPASIDHQRRQR